MIYEEAKEAPKRKVDEKGNVWILNEETLTYYKDEEMPLTEEQIMSKLVQENSWRWGSVRYNYLKEKYTYSIYKYLMFENWMLEECIITADKMHARIGELVNDYRTKNNPHTNNFEELVKFNYEANAYAEEIAIKEIIETDTVYTNYGMKSEKKEIKDDN